MLRSRREETPTRAAQARAQFLPAPMGRSTVSRIHQPVPQKRMQRMTATAASGRNCDRRRRTKNLGSVSHAIGLRGVCAAVLALTAVFCLWRSREAIGYLSRTPEGRYRVLRESVAALFYMNQTGALPVGAAGKRRATGCVLQPKSQFQCADSGAGSGGNRVHAGGSAHPFAQGSRLSAACAGL